ncbi:hypothetical protein N2152v2_007033 [Parachlorella kessleri]
MLVGLTPLRHMYLDWGLVFRNPLKRPPQVWRLLTNFTFIGKPSMHYLFQLIWLVQYGGSLEAADYQHNAADGVFMLLVGMATTLALDFVVPLFRNVFHGSSLIFMLLYLWSKRNPHAPISILGLLQLQGLYLPFAFMAVDLVVGAAWQPDLLGILAGHLARLVARSGLGRVPLRQVNAANPADLSFRAFQGRGRRLAD